MTPRVYAEEGKAKEFGIFKETSDPYDNDKASGKITLTEATYIGGELYMIPLQIYETSHPLLLKAVCLITILIDDRIKGGTYGVIQGNNIRTVEITCDGTARYDDNGHRSPAVWSLVPEGNHF
jgi:hypothetical protein